MLPLRYLPRYMSGHISRYDRSHGSCLLLSANAPKAREVGLLSACLCAHHERVLGQERGNRVVGAAICVGKDLTPVLGRPRLAGGGTDTQHRARGCLCLALICSFHMQLISRRTLLFGRKSVL